MLQQFTKLLEKEVDRKEFLIYLGLIILTVLGISSKINTISTVINGKQKGFGAGPYGK